ncbi:MAG: 1-phosphofructokinase [Moraxella sp.]|nr:1-phosphofructokinase [Moraxella sp.]
MAVLCITLNPALDMTFRVSHLNIGAVNRTGTGQINAAGKGLNVAQILHELGHDVLLTGFLGGDNAEPFIKLCESKNNQHVFDNRFVMVNGSTRTNVKLVDDTGLTTDINSQGFAVNETDKARFFDELQTLLPAASAAVIAGSLPSGFELDDFDRLLTLAKTNARLAVDVSGAALKIAVSHNPWLIKPNEEELSCAFGLPADTTEEQQALLNTLNAKIDNVVISMGEKGVNWFGKQNLHALPPKVDVASTVGAGDTLLAGMIHGLLGADDDEQILATATALSAHAVTIVGFGIPNEDRLEQLKEQVTVKAYPPFAM